MPNYSITHFVLRVILHSPQDDTLFALGYSLKKVTVTGATIDPFAASAARDCHLATNYRG
ncbi:hypothetical protein [Candidatus Leptofilum sp.]|uniref:hypothetical protein n=1 Tax=Candidatus Leptofilum sp. TaxID=3241576 RepID=UPI003B5CD82C